MLPVDADHLTKVGSSSASAAGPRNNFLAKLLVIARGAFLGCLIFELGLRAVGFAYGGSFFGEDRIRGWCLRPGAHGTATGEAKQYIRINSDGLRDREHAVPKPPGTLRIAVLGDSCAEAVNVPLEKTFWAVLERQLSHPAAVGNRTVEVINFGVGGYGTAQEFLTLRERVWKYNPDIVLLAFYTGNDLFNNYRPLNINSEPAPYFVYDRQNLVLDNSFHDSWKFSSTQVWLINFRGYLRDHLRVLQCVARAIDAFRIMAYQTNLRHTAADLGVRDLEEVIYFPPTDAGMKEAWRVTEGLLILVRDEVRAHGAEPWLVTLANPSQVNPDPAQQQAFMQRVGIDTLFYPDQRLRAFAQKADIPVITLAPLMSAYAEAHHVFLHGGHNIPLGQGHWNENGHELAGEVIASELRAHSRKLSGSVSTAASQ
jgi:hypothetical protein